MTGQELANIAKSFLNETTCYLLGFWGQYCSQTEYKRVNFELARSGKNNDKYNNQRYIGDSSCYPFDCINFVKGILGGCRPGRRISYNQMKANPVGDCTPEDFGKQLLDVLPKPSGSYYSDVPAGYGLAKSGHAALSLGGGNWIDVSYNNSQNGAMMHSGGIPREYTCGKIPTIDYSDQPVPEPGDAEDFRNYLMDHAPETIATLYEKWRKQNG